MILFARKPISGAVKTRLAASIGNKEALAAYKELLHRTTSICLDLQVNKFIFWAGEGGTELPKVEGFVSREQEGVNLGERMGNAIKTRMNEDPGPCVLIGTDCFDLKKEDLQLAFDNLYEKDVVLGPAADGGYYLIGMNKLFQNLFYGVTWGRDQVFSQTLRKIDQEQLSCFILEERRDLDDYPDYLEYRKHGQ